MQSTLIIMSLIGGLTLTVQAGINTMLAKHLGSSILTAAISFAVGTVCLVALSAFIKTPIPPMNILKSIPLFLWVGGAFGAYYVALVVYASSKLGAAAFFTITIAAQLISSVIVDHYGLIGFSQNPISWQKLLGVAFLVLGVILIKKY